MWGTKTSPPGRGRTERVEPPANHTQSCPEIWWCQENNLLVRRFDKVSLRSGSCIHIYIYTCIHMTHVNLKSINLATSSTSAVSFSLPTSLAINGATDLRLATTGRDLESRRLIGRWWPLLGVFVLQDWGLALIAEGLLVRRLACKAWAPRCNDAAIDKK